jgi:hypothetical protein
MATLQSRRSATLPFVLALAALLSAGSALADCRKVGGRYQERLVTAGCTSPVGVCIQGEYEGSLAGGFRTAVETFVPTADVPPTGAAQFTAGSTLTVRIGHRQGTLTVRNAGALRTTGGGEIVDLQIIVGGSGGFAGATGAMTATGSFSFIDGNGRSTFVGEVCVPGAF